MKSLLANRSLLLVLAAMFAAYFGESVYGNIFNNYLDDIHKIDAGARGWIEFPRELPGVLSVFVVGALFFLRENSIGAVACALFGAGLLGFCVPSLSGGMTIVWFLIMLASLGQHMLMVLSDAIVIHMSKEENRSVRLGQMKAFITAAALLGSLYVWVKWHYNKDYTVDFIVAAGMCFLAAVFFQKVQSAHFPKSEGAGGRFVFRRRYWLYYVLEIFFGARKQVFITFGFWVLVSELGKSPSDVGRIMLVAGVLGLFFKPFIGKLIQIFGERSLLIADSALLVVVCMVYALALRLFSFETASLLICGCFVADNLLFAMSTARTSYLSKISERKEHITPTLYTGMAINHVMSIVAAVLGGQIWNATGSHVWVFVFCALLAACSGLASMRIGREPRVRTA